MAHEPCMTLKELAKLKGLSLQALTYRSKKLPYPEPFDFAGKYKTVQANIHRRAVQANIHRRAAQYPRSALLKWFDEASAL